MEVDVEEVEVETEVVVPPEPFTVKIISVPAIYLVGASVSLKPIFPP